MHKLKNIHFALGVSILIHFAITGALLRFNVFHIDRADIIGRMMFRANHLYIAFSGLVNLLCAFTFSAGRKLNKLVYLSSFLMIAGAIGISLAFYIDPVTHSMQRDLTRFSVIACFAGTVLHALLLWVNSLGNKDLSRDSVS